MEKAKRNLRIAGILEMLIAVLSILALYGLMGYDKAFLGISNEGAKDILIGVAGLYGIYICQALAGLVGVVMAGKKSIITVILGILLLLVQLVSFMKMEHASFIGILINIAFLTIPFFYLYSAYNIYQNK